MVFLELLEVLLGCLVFLFMATQVLLPLYRGTPYFPFFHKEMRGLDEKLKHTKEKVEAAELRKRIRYEKEIVELLREEGKEKKQVKEENK